MFDFVKRQAYVAPLFFLFLFQDESTHNVYESYTNMDSTTLWIVIGCSLVLTVFFIACFWKIFEKAGEPGWASIIPIYNTIIMLKIAGKPWWWIFLLLIPLVNLIFAIIVLNDLAKNFGKGTGFVVGLIFLPYIFFPILAFGSARYIPYQQQFQQQPPYPPQFPPPQPGGYR
jgi:ABC-type sulfate transport system permease subunit